MQDGSQQPILLIGGTGKTGSRVAERLGARGIPVRVGSRSGTPPFDWQDETTWKGAVEGVQAAYITYHPDIALPGAVEAIGAFTETAIANGVRRLVLLSGRGEEEAARAEQALIGSNADWTVVRASWFAQNFSESFLIDGILAGEVVFPRDGVPEPFIDAEDIADVVAATLVEEGHVGQIHEITGPRLLTFREAVAEIAAATGRDIRYVPITVDDYVAALKGRGVPEPFVQLLELLTREVLDGRNARVTDGVRQALGREPRDFAGYVQTTACSGAWQG